jgi:hypothetical protein
VASRVETQAYVALYDFLLRCSVMADYIVHLAITITPDVDPQELQGGLNLPDVRKRLGDMVGAALILPHVPEGQKYPKAGTFAVGSVTVEKK